MTTPEQERINRNVQRTTSVSALRKIRHIVEGDLHEEKMRARLLRSFLCYGWIILLLAAWLLADFLGVF